jgi:photosystem II stability/assembly factor-like uncharacterized protein
MKKLILSELLLLFLATTFVTDSLPPGWYQQTLPVNDLINDIFFLDSLTGWVVTDGRTSTNDTGYVMKTTNGGNNWTIQYNQPMKLNAVQFIDANTGYVVGGSGSGTGRIFRTTNSGGTWTNISTFSSLFSDVSFVNTVTGWVCDNSPLDGGIFKTTNGGANWNQQLGASFSIRKLFFINSDTGWAGSADSKLYRTIDGGSIWSLIYTFTPASNVIRGFYFLNSDTGWSINYSGSSINGIYKTTNGGFNWVTQIDPDPFGSGLSGIYMANSNVGYIATGFSRIIKTWNGQDWYRQNTPDGTYLPIHGVDSNKVWAGGAWVGNYFLIHTTDGGGPPQGIIKISNEIPSNFKLYQNYPNPFNPTTKIKYDVKRQTSNVKLIVHNIQGKFIKELVNRQQNPGTYEVNFSGEGLSSGVYFYKIIITAGKEVFSDTKRMLMIK